MISDFCSSLSLVTYEASAPKIMKQLKKKAGNHKHVDTILKFNISRNGLEAATLINMAFSRTNTGFKMALPNPHCVLRIREHDVHSNH